jgi:hypothetical protein
MVAPSFNRPVHIPILVGVTGKRKSGLEKLGVLETLVRTKLRRAFALVDELAPSGPKILLCGMADGVDEIAARLVIGPDEQDPNPREFRDWSIVGLLPMPEEAFLDDFGAGGGWWYHTLDAKQRKFIRLMPLQTLAKSLPDEAGSSTLTRYTSDDLRRPKHGSNPVRTAHYEQLGMVLAERSTILIAVMPEDEEPDRPGGTAQVVAHRLNGWRPGWPPALSIDIAARSNEIAMPAPLATPVANDAWLIPIGDSDGKDNETDLRIMRRREEFERAWPEAPLSAGPARHTIPWLPRRADPDALIVGRYSNRKAAVSSCPLLRPIQAFNRRAANTTARPPPAWDDTIRTNTQKPGSWSPLAAAERLRGTLADIQRNRKSRIGRTVTGLAWIAIISIAFLELYAEFESWKPLHVVPYVYVALIVSAVLIYRNALRKFWPAIAEDYRLVAEALRVQIVWWQIGLTARRDRVDNVVLRYDKGEFQRLRRGLGTLLDAIQFSCAEFPAAPADRLPVPVMQWIDNEDQRNRGQIQYHSWTAVNRKRRYGRNEFLAWSLFGISLGAAVWLVIYTSVNMLDWVSGISPRWLVPVLATAAVITLLLVLRIEDIRSPERALKAPHILGSWAAGIFLGAAIAWSWAIFDLDPDWLRKLFFLGSVIPLAWGGIARYRTEKIAIEAEAEGSEMTYPIYRRAKAALDEIEKNCSVAEAMRRREKIIRDLGEFALAETEAWLRSHRERPLHPALA